MIDVGIIIVATGGEKYTRFISPLIASLREFFVPSDVFLFTDSREKYDAEVFEYPNYGWPDATMRRFHAILGLGDRLRSYDALWLMDADLRLVAPITKEEMFGVGLSAVIHPHAPDTFERRPESKAFIGGKATYYQCCWAAGSTSEFLIAAEEIAKNIDSDAARGITAVWFEESHWNRYLADHPPVRPQPPTFACPQGWSSPAGWTPAEVKIRHLDKPGQDGWKVNKLSGWAR